MKKRINGDAIRSAMRSIGMSQSELAAAAGLRQATISRLVSGRTEMPQHDTVRRIADVLGCGVEDLLAAQLGNVEWRKVLLRDEYEAALLDMWRQLGPDARIRLLAAVQKIVSNQAASDAAATLEEVDRRVEQSGRSGRKKAQ